MTVQAIRVSPGWLELRERADAAARSRELVERVRRQLPECGPLVIHDLASGTGSMGRWLAPLLPGPQRWVLHDRDGELLALADVPDVTLETRVSDVTKLGREGLAGASLVTASALLDLLTQDELAGLIDACAGAECPVLLTLSVTGRVELVPTDPLDSRLAAAFDAHQRRGGLLGPDSVTAAVEGFRRLGAEVVVSSSPWRLDAADAALVVEWLAGRVGAAIEQEPDLAAEADLYLRRRVREARAGRLAVTVGHADLLVLP